jgi:hypothetical protein
MSADLDQLLRDAGRPGSPPDIDRLWGRGRRRRLARRAAGVGTTLALVGVVVAGAGSLLDGVVGGPSPLPPLGQDEDALPEPVEAPDEPDEPGEPGEPGGTVDEPGMDAGDAIIDPALLAAPCTGHEARLMEAFIALVSPVTGARHDGTIDLIGCSNVYEATVQYRVSDAADGTVLVEGFTTATCGSGCVGEFRETIDLRTLPDGAAGATVVVEVFWEDAEDGSAADTQSVLVAPAG